MSTTLDGQGRSAEFVPVVKVRSESVLRALNCACWCRPRRNELCEASIILRASTTHHGRRRHACRHRHRHLGPYKINTTFRRPRARSRSLVGACDPQVPHLPPMVTILLLSPSGKAISEKVCNIATNFSSDMGVTRCAKSEKYRYNQVRNGPFEQ